MSIAELRRSTKQKSIECTTTLATTGRLNYNNYSGGVIITPAGIAETVITWHTSDGNNNRVPCNDADGNAITQTINASNSYTLPDTLFGCNNLVPLVDISVSLIFVLKT